MSRTSRWITRYISGVVRFTPFEQSLCFSWTLKSKASADCLFLTRRYVDCALTQQLGNSAIFPAFQLVIV